jgi:hypothetical protein
MAILLVRDTGIEAAVTSINYDYATLPHIMWHIKQWQETEPLRLSHFTAEHEARQRRIAAGEEQPLEWTPERLQAYRERMERKREELQRAQEERLERLYQERYGDWRPPQPTQEEVLQYYREMASGDKSCLDLTVVQYLAMSLEEKYQHCEQVTAAWHELQVAYPEVVPVREDPFGATKKPQ